MISDPIHLQEPPYLLLSLSRVGLALPVNVLSHFDIRDFPSVDRDGRIAERAYRNLDILWSRVHHVTLNPTNTPTCPQTIK